MDSASSNAAPSSPAAFEATARSNTLLLVALSLLLLIGLTVAVLLAWVCDDSFISFRYAENLVNGRGLVYNAGERVEGYTNLLWTLLIAAFMKAGADPVPVAEYLGIAAYGALALCLAHWSWRRARRTGRAFLPLAAGLVLVSNDFHVWASGGLETMLFAYLALQGLVLTRMDRGGRRAPALAGILFALLVLTRPDGLLFAAAGALSYWIAPRGLPRRARLDHSVTTLAPVAITLALLIPFKLSYYGEIFPTAFYSKSVLRPYYSQGLVYVGLYLAKNWFLIAALALALAARRLGRWNSAPADGRHGAFFLGTCALFVAYLVHIGGDFMFARRLVPAIPLVFLAIEERLVRVPRRRAQAALAVAALAAAALTFVPHGLIYSGAPYRIRYVADEPRFYSADRIEWRKDQARVVGQALAGTNVRVAFEGGMCVFGYYSKLPYLAEMTGLTQYSLAKLPLDKRGFVGHEKSGDEQWLTENDIHLLVRQRVPPPPSQRGLPGYDQLYFGNIAQAQIVVYSDEVMDALRGVPEVSFMGIERLLERSRKQIENSSLAMAEQLYAKLYRYYFRAAGESARRQAQELREIIERKRRESAARS
jgi:hypothetical protein